MATLTIELSDEVLAQLEAKATQIGKTAASLGRELIMREVRQSPMTKEEYLAERERIRQALKEAGLVSDVPPSLLEKAQHNISIEKVREALSRDGKPMSEIVIEQRGSLY